MKKKIMKIITIVLGGFILLAIVGLLFVHFMPGFGLYFVKSASMEPKIRPGDIVITGPVGGWPTGNIKVGSVITFKDSDAIVTHRIVAIDGNSITTKGDANKHQDTHPTQLEAIQGIYWFKIPYIGYINSFVSNRSGWFLVIIIPTIALVIFIVKDIVKEALKGPKKDNKEIKIEGGDSSAGKKD